MFSGEISENNDNRDVIITKDGGIAVLMKNKTGATSVKGMIVQQGTEDLSFEVSEEGEDHAIGIVYTDGQPEGGPCWVVVSGIADVLFKDTVAPSTTFYHIYQDASVAGRANGQTTVNTARHWGEVGHCMESKDSGTDVLAKCVIHFN